MIKSVFRISILIALSLVLTVTLFGEPKENSGTWMIDFLLSKLIAAGCGYALYKLYPRWVKVDKYIKAFDKWNSNGIEQC